MRIIAHRGNINGPSEDENSIEQITTCLDLGYDVDAISPYDTEFIPQKTYDVIFDIHYNLCRFEKFLSKKTITILYSTGSYPEYAANREIERVNNLVYRKKMAYKPKRICDRIFFTKSLDISNFKRKKCLT